MTIRRFPTELITTLAALAIGAWLTACATSNARRLGDGGPDDDAVVERCGNGELDEGEDCDDGNTVSGDGCSPTCEIEICGPDSCPWGCCDPYGACQGGAQDLLCGMNGEDCQDCQSQGTICQDRVCNDLGTCTPGDTLVCGDCGTRTCSAGETWGACEDQGDCTAGQVVTTGSCGNCGELQRSCESDCTWSGLECRNEGPCTPGDTEEGNACGTCSVEVRSCQNDCTWGQWTCISHEECTPGDTDTGSTCGNCGTEESTCQADCTWGPYECVGEGVCGVGDTSGTGCGACALMTCTAQCQWGPCENPPETCNGADDDCDGVCDNGYACCRNTSESCATTCGSTGNRTCNASCSWGACVAPSETCNGVDDDCDSTADEGYRAEAHNAYYTGTGAMDDYDSTCNGTSQEWGLDCNYAIHAWCRAESPGCLSSGYGPVEHNGNDLSVNCVAGAWVHTVGYGTLQSYHASCVSSDPISGACYYAIHHYCAAQGWSSGFGPITSNSSSNNMQLACISNGTVINTTYTTLSGQHPGCDGTTQRLGPDCNAAIKRYCTSTGHTGGYGPVSNFNDDCVIVCIDP